jgi:hypothetical protein
MSLVFHPIALRGINETEKNVPVIFYNRENEILYLEGLTEKNGVLILYNETGQELLKRSINGNEKINISGLNDGFYTAVLRSAIKIAYKKIIKF